MQRGKSQLLKRKVRVQGKSQTGAAETDVGARINLRCS